MIKKALILIVCFQSLGAIMHRGQSFNHADLIFASFCFQLLETSMSEWAVMSPCSVAPWTMTRQCHGR